MPSLFASPCVTVEIEQVSSAQRSARRSQWRCPDRASSVYDLPPPIPRPFNTGRRPALAGLGHPQTTESAAGFRCARQAQRSLQLRRRVGLATRGIRCCSYERAFSCIRRRSALGRRAQVRVVPSTVVDDGRQRDLRGGADASLSQAGLLVHNPCQHCGFPTLCLRAHFPPRQRRGRPALVANQVAAGSGLVHFEPNPNTGWCSGTLYRYVDYVL